MAPIKAARKLRLPQLQSGSLRERVAKVLRRILHFLGIYGYSVKCLLLHPAHSTGYDHHLVKLQLLVDVLAMASVFAFCSAVFHSCGILLSRNWHKHNTPNPSRSAIQANALPASRCALKWRRLTSKLLPFLPRLSRKSMRK